MLQCQADSRKEKKRKDYAFRRQFNEKPSIILGCPGQQTAPDSYFGCFRRPTRDKLQQQRLQSCCQVLLFLLLLVIIFLGRMLQHGRCSMNEDTGCCCCHSDILVLQQSRNLQKMYS